MNKRRRPSKLVKATPGSVPVPSPSAVAEHVVVDAGAPRFAESTTMLPEATVAGERTVHRSLYRRLPAMTCLDGCSDCCGPTPISPWEARRLGIEGAATTPVHEGTATCAFLVDSRCSVHERRPFACRLYGTSPAAPCPHGAGPAQAHAVPVAVVIELFKRFESTCPPDWHEARHRAVRAVVDRDGSNAERASLDVAETFRDRGRRFVGAMQTARTRDK